jgi:hypothetical protein
MSLHFTPKNFLPGFFAKYVQIVNAYLLFIIRCSSALVSSYDENLGLLYQNRIHRLIGSDTANPIFQLSISAYILEILKNRNVLRIHMAKTA